MGSRYWSGYAELSSFIEGVYGSSLEIGLAHVSVESRNGYHSFEPDTESLWLYVRQTKTLHSASDYLRRLC